MPPLYTQNLGIEKPANGEEDGSWGTLVNENMDIIDRAINGVLSLALSGTASTLTTTSGTLNNGQYKLLALGGTPSGTHTITLSPNTAQKIYYVANASGQTVIFTQGSGPTYTLLSGDSAIIYAFGTGASSGVSNIADFFAMSSPRITGGSIDGATVGATTAAAITGTTITVAGGTASAPGYTFTGDTNTGMYSGGADVLSFSSVGVESLRVAGNGVHLPAATTETKFIEIGTGRTGNGGSIIDLIGDATYTDYGARLVRAGGPDATTNLIHRGTGNLAITASDAGIINFYTNSAERMRISANGNIGIGTTATPSTKLRVEGTVSTLEGTIDLPAYTFTNDPNTGMYRSAEGRLSFATNGFESLQLNGNTRNFPVDGGDGAIILGNGRTTDSSVHYNLVGDTTYTAYGLRMLRAAGANGTSGLFHRGTGALTLSAQDAASITFVTNSVEAARINSGGQFLVGVTAYVGVTTAPSLQVSDLGHINVNAVANSNFNKLTADGSVITFRRQNTGVGSINVTASATSYATSSDYRLKENVVPVANAADRLMLLQPRNFNFLSDPANPVDGFLAHEAQAIVPNAVTGVKDEVDAEGAPVHQSIDHSKMVPLLTAALQEALAKISALEVRIAALEA